MNNTGEIDPQEIQPIRHTVDIAGVDTVRIKDSTVEILHKIANNRDSLGMMTIPEANRVLITQGATEVVVEEDIVEVGIIGQIVIETGKNVRNVVGQITKQKTVSHVNIVIGQVMLSQNVELNKETKKQTEVRIEIEEPIGEIAQEIIGIKKSEGTRDVTGVQKRSKKVG